MHSKQIYYRLVAFWVICETMLGGIIHGLKLPVSGLIVGGAAVICICMLAFYYPVRGSIIKATIIVAIFKMMLSPQSPLPAYLAVFFQGLIGELIFLNRKTFRLNCIVFGILALVESGIQRLLVMTIIYGKEIWEAINIFVNSISGTSSKNGISVISGPSYYIAAGYVLLHLIVGIFLGWYAGLIPSKVKNHDSSDLIVIDENEAIESGKLSKKKKRKFLFLIVWIILAGLFIVSTVFPAKAILPSKMILGLLLRSVLIILTWVVIINPILIKLLHKWLERKKRDSASDIQEVTMLLPVTQLLIAKSWKLSSRKRGIKRISLFFKIVVFNSLQHG